MPKMSLKKMWRCNVCNDIHYGNLPPKTCPTCFAKKAYCEIDSKEANNLISDCTTKMSTEELRASWETFTKDTNFVLNPDKEHVDTIIKGVLDIEKNTRLKLCPCRLTDKTRARELELICPCNFQIQENWKTKGECWCGLFIKKI